MQLFKIIALLIYTLLCVNNCVTAQSISKGDSLEIKINNYKLLDTTKVKMYLECANYYYGRDAAKLIQNSNDALLLSTKIKYKKGEAEALRFLGVGAYMKGNFTETENYFNKAYQVNKQLNNTKGVIACLSNLGSVNMVQNKYKVALDYYKQGLKISTQQNDLLNSGIIYGNIGVIYSELKDYPNALKHFEGGVQMHSKMAYKIGIANGLGNIGNVFFKQKNFQNALNNYTNALEINASIDNKLATAREYGNIANAHVELQNYRDAYTNYSTALTINQQLKNKKGEAVILQGLANYYSKINKSDTALEYSLAALQIAKTINIKDVQIEALQNIYTIQEKNKQFPNAYETYKQYILLKNELENDENKKAILRLETQFEFDKKEDEYKNTQLLTSAKLVQQTLQIDNGKLLLLKADKDKEVQKLKYLQTQAELQNQELIINQSAEKLIITEQEKNLQKNKNEKLQKEKLLKELELKSFWLYAIITGLIMAVLFFTIFALVRIKNLKQKNNLNQQIALQKQEAMVLQNNIKETEMTLLRSQMNPHFIFNSINSINNFILKNDKFIASDYLNTFAKLMRSILDNSKNESITLQQETEALQWYMDLESLRLQNKFTYNFVISNDIDTTFTHVPPLILQPFVENAIWHGIRHKPNSGIININICNTNNGIKIIITDDGIGRVAASKLMQSSLHKSYGVVTTIQRIKLLNKSNDVQIEDMYENETPTGTKVILILNV